ncbi:MAG TPA: LacI family DNA-binding transcriptional regulator [Aggregatilineales bacterium]|nr:LacI family DNA-binding transcriptional regulator [Anaerolineae bacterium]HUN06839.1 LacI family DNA-binding transcriptional regulator [Aggregatilineales bacterium]
MSTMREVAEHAEVSLATVSRVINNVGYVSPDLRERVEAAMRALSYQPSALARSLRRQESRAIGLLIPQLDQPFFAALAFAIEGILFENDYRMLLCSAQEDEARERAYAEILIRQRVDGVIAVPTGQGRALQDLMGNRKLPLVLLDRDLPDLYASRVLVNNDQGGYDGMMHLLKLGHRHVRVIGAPTYSIAMQQRIAGARRALREFGIHDHDPIIVSGTLPQYEMGMAAANHLFDESPHPTAIFALTDVTAVGVMHAAAQRGLSVPAALSVIGFDDIPLAGFMIPSLTTVAQPIRAMGQEAARLVLEQIEYPDFEPEHVVLPTHLVVRDSTRVYPG